MNTENACWCVVITITLVIVQLTAHSGNDLWLETSSHDYLAHCTGAQLAWASKISNQTSKQASKPVKNPTTTTKMKKKKNLKNMMFENFTDFNISFSFTLLQGICPMSLLMQRSKLLTMSSFWKLSLTHFADTVVDQSCVI